MEEEKKYSYKEKRQSFIDSFKKTDYKKNDLRYYLFYYNKTNNIVIFGKLNY